VIRTYEGYSVYFTLRDAIKALSSGYLGGLTTGQGREEKIMLQVACDRELHGTSRAQGAVT
jgi:hypothetical protein